MKAMGQRRLTFFERMKLFNYRITKVSQVTDKMSLFEVEGSNIRAILKTTNSGKAEYHKLNSESLQKVKDDLDKM